MIGFLLALALSQPAIRPDPQLTPGLTRPLSRSTVCTTKWSLDRRHVTEAMKRQVFAAYQVPWSQRSRFEVDHLIPRSLAGADAILNLWPQAWAGPYGARKKDRLEVDLGRRVCRGDMALAFAQETLRSDWIAAYRLYIEARPAQGGIWQTAGFLPARSSRLWVLLPPTLHKAAIDTRLRVVCVSNIHAASAALILAHALPPVAIAVTPRISIEPGSFRLRITVEPDPGNRALLVSFTGDGYLRRFGESLDGESADRTRERTIDQIPAGEYVVSACVAQVKGIRCALTQTVTVIGHAPEVMSALQKERVWHRASEQVCQLRRRHRTDLRDVAVAVTHRDLYQPCVSSLWAHEAETIDQPEHGSAKRTSVHL